ncbi:MAG: T9SS type A sorting domain-containing protein [Chitinophagales bacterium]
MKLITPLIISSFCLTYSISAQPVISSAAFGEAGDSYVMKGIEEISLEPGDGGADVTWDFSTAVLNGGTDMREVVDAATSTYGSDFPDANIATVTNDTSFTYYFISGVLLSYYGTATPSLSQIFDEPADLVDFPVTYNDTKTDDFSGSATILGFEATLTGSSTMIADGYGTVILPGGASYSDVLRLKLDLNILAEVTGLPITAEINSTIYYWLLDGITGPVIQYTSAETAISGFPTTPAIFIDVNDDLLADVSGPPAISFNVFPTLADEFINVSSETGGQISIYTLTGEKMLSQKVVSSDEVKTNSFPEGNYLVVLQTEKGLASKIIAIAHQ